MVFIKRYELIKRGDAFLLTYKKEEIKLKASNWEEAEEESKKTIEKLRKENKEPNTAIVWG